jgi:hypothetical protein
MCFSPNVSYRYIDIRGANLPKEIIVEQDKRLLLGNDYVIRKNEITVGSSDLYATLLSSGIMQ